LLQKDLPTTMKKSCNNESMWCKHLIFCIIGHKQEKELTNKKKEHIEKMSRITANNSHQQYKYFKNSNIYKYFLWQPNGKDK